MRLLYLGSTDLPQPKARAIQIVHTCHALARAGAEVTLAVGRRGGGSAADALRGYGLEPHPGLRLLRLPILRIPPTAPPRVLAQFTRVWQASYLAGLAAALPLELATHRPDVVFARDLRVAKLAAGPAHAIGAKLVFEVHGLPSYEVAQGAGRASLPPAQATRLRRLEQQVFDAADRIVTITECARQILLKEYGVPAWKVRTVADGTTVAENPDPQNTPHPPPPSPSRGEGESNWIFPSSITAESPADCVGLPSPLDAGNGDAGRPEGRGPVFVDAEGPRVREGVGVRGVLGVGTDQVLPPETRPLRGANIGSADIPKPETPRVYYVGQLYPWKGAGLVVDVAARVPDARFVVVGGMPNGSQPDPDLAALGEQARAAGAAERVDLRGYVPYRQVSEELRAASVALLPLPDEPVARLFTSPLKLFDYMAAGVAIVASDLPSLREVLRHEQNALLAKPGDADAFASAVRRLLANPTLARRLGGQARADVRQYSWDARAAALLDFMLAPDGAAC